jgi:signal transduction histidine kinase
MALREKMWFGRSIFVQMALVTIVFLGWSFYTVVVSPLFERPEVMDETPMALTRSAASSILNRYSFAQRSGETAIPPEANEEFARILAANPGMRYYVEAGDTQIGNIAEPQLLDRFGIGEINRALRQTTASDHPCANLSRNFEEAGGWSYIEYTFCDSYSYVEYTGLAKPIDLKPAGARGYENWVSLYSDYYLYPVVMVFAFFAIIIMLNFALIKRVARVAQAIDPDGNHCDIPEQGVPAEVLPLVRSVNQVIALMDKDQRHRRLFLSAAAHEMRTPLTVLRTRLEMIDDAEQRDRLIGDVQRLSSMVNQLLLLMGVRERRLESDVDLADIIRDVRDQHLSSAIESDVAIRLDLPDGPVRLRANGELLAVAIGNLLENALRFAPPGSDVVIGLDEDATITVGDRGPGVPEERIGDIFEPFVRLKKSRGGHGLGLAIVKAIAELHRGQVTVANRDEGGALFTLRIGTEDHRRSA